MHVTNGIMNTDYTLKLGETDKLDLTPIFWNWNKMCAKSYPNTHLYPHITPLATTIQYLTFIVSQHCSTQPVIGIYIIELGDVGCFPYKQIVKW